MEDRVLMQNGVTDFDGLNHAVWTVGLLRSFASQNTTVGMDFSCIDYSHVRVLYPHPILHPFFTRISSTPDRVFYQIFYERLHYDLRRSNNFSVIRPKTLERQSQELARSIDSEDRLLLNRVRHYIVSLLDMDKYCRAAILQALLLDCTKKIQERNFAHKHIGSYIMLTRYCDAGGSLLHLCDYPCPEGHPSEEMDYLNLPSAAVLELHIERGEAFFSAGYDPIIAGRTACGKLAYIAEAHFGLYDRCYCAVTEGMKPENLRFTMQGQRLKAPESFVVYVLRYEPFEYARKEWDEYGAEGLDPTGPFSWRTLIVKKQAMDRYKIGYFGPKQEPLSEVGQADSEEDASDEEDWKTAEE
ncbi:hypothetical protein DFH11DRAFT_1619856 [Phellopilus nigrolimitatus]|nr:hypothetical protein DFH11DRAFT_1619856 [Phellopilus nigrolimitatus]